MFYSKVYFVKNINSVKICVFCEISWRSQSAVSLLSLFRCENFFLPLSTLKDTVWNWLRQFCFATNCTNLNEWDWLCQFWFYRKDAEAQRFWKINLG